MWWGSHVQKIGGATSPILSSVYLFVILFNVEKNVIQYNMKSLKLLEIPIKMLIRVK